MTTMIHKHIDDKHRVPLAIISSMEQSNGGEGVSPTQGGDKMDKLFAFGRPSKTFRPRKTIPVGSKGATLKRHIEATLGTGNMLQAVALPEGEDLNEWLAVNTVDFYNAINILYATLDQYCTLRKCPVMSAGQKYEYLWADGVKVKKPQKLPAPEYINNLFDWVEAQIDNPVLFPQQYGVPFPPNFQDVVRTMFKRLFRVYAHIYHSHFRDVVNLDVQRHLNTCFKHFVYFVTTFKLVEAKELAPCQGAD